MPRRIYAGFDGRRVSALVRRGQEPGIVFLHGLCCGATHFDQAFTDERLSHLALVAVDLPGFGASSKFGFASLETMARATSHILAENGIARPWIVAHSMAASVAVRLLDISAGIIFLEGNILPAHLEFSDRIIAVNRQSFPSEFKRLQRTAVMILKYQTRSVDTDALKNYAATWSQCSADTVWATAAEINQDIRSGLVSERFAAYTRPLVCLHGSDGSYAQTIGNIARALPPAEFIAIPGTAHYPMLDAPEATYGAIARTVLEGSSKC